MMWWMMLQAYDQKRRAKEAEREAQEAAQQAEIEKAEEERTVRTPFILSPSPSPSLPLALNPSSSPLPCPCPCPFPLALEALVSASLESLHESASRSSNALGTLNPLPRSLAIRPAEKGGRRGRKMDEHDHRRRGTALRSCPLAPCSRSAGSHCRRCCCLSWSKQR